MTKETRRHRKYYKLYDNNAQKHSENTWIKCIKKSKKEGLCGIDLDE